LLAIGSFGLSTPYAIFSQKPEACLPKEKTSYFYHKYQSMRLSKLTALLLSLPLFILISCSDKTEDVERENIFYGTALPMSSSQETPPFTSTATGSIDANYNRLTKTLSYKVTFSGLSGNATMAHIHGPGEAGVKAVVLQTFVGFPAKTSGTYSGTLLADEVKVKEEYILGGRYYINIHTAAKTEGEIRGQLNLAKK
jgi:hypothetical protein